jgi:phosphoglycerol transferase MdoB-like AlkP superfamily enzyme
VTIFIVFSGLMAKISWYPLRWSDAFFSTHAYSAQLASNPVIYFSNTLKNVAETYDLEAAKQAYPIMTDYLGIQQPQQSEDGTLNYDRYHDYAHSAGISGNRTNVIVVILESFASYKTSLSGNPLLPTPHIERLAQEGYYFKNFFTPSTGTARSIWTLVTGLPDIEKNKTSSRNPLIVDQHTIINAFRDHKKLYFLGGSASWANVRGLLSSNIPDLRLFEEGSYDSPDIDVWGISDLSLFREANAVLKDETEPFFAIIQTSGNHRPYTIPDDNEGFVTWTEEDLQHDVRKYGFQSLEELNSFRFMDHSVGHFMKIAEKQPYFENTLFVFFGDHGIHAPTGAHIPAYEAQLNLQGLRVPLVLYGKSVIGSSRVFDTIASEVDVLPTIAAVTRTSYLNTTIGRDLTDSAFDDDRYAFTIEHGSGRTIGLLSDDYYLLMKPDGSNKRLHHLTAEDARTDVSAKEAEIAELMTRKLTAIWNTVRYMRENNKPEQ